jgi:glycosyltransferase involved in cell wall biosynthesis
MATERQLVSCILATGDRLRFLRQAIRFFLRQSYREAELIVVDGGRESAVELCAGLLAVRHIRVSPESSLGTRLNLGIERARGSILQKIDDDDFYHPSFLERAVETLERSQAGTVVAWDCFHVLLAGQTALRFSGHGWAAGGTLCFHRELWERTPFRDRSRAVDYFFFQDANPRIQRVCAPEMYMLVRHGANTWQQHAGGSAESFFRGLRLARQRLHDIVEPIDIPFYDALANEAAS